MPEPLEGVRIVDLSRYIAGPLCAQILGDMGAEVIKVEPPDGEDGRIGLPIYESYSLYFASYNRNKLGVTLNLRTEKGKHLLRQMVERADVLVQNFRPGTMERMGLGNSHLAEINPGLITVNIAGFNPLSPYVDWPAYDEIAQAVSGLMDLTGPADGPPTLIGVYIIDHLTGLYAAIGALAALEQRRHTGKGQSVDVALVDSAVATLSTQIPWKLLTGQSETRNGNRNRRVAAINTYGTKDGYVYINAGRDHQWSRLVEIMGVPELRSAPAFATREARTHQKEQIDAIIGRWTAERTSEEVAAVLATSGVPSGPVRTVGEVAADPSLMASGMVLNVRTPEGAIVPVMGSPVRLASQACSVRKSPPAVGEHNEQVYGSLLGYSSEEIAAWRASGVI